MSDFTVANVDVENYSGDIRYKNRKCGSFRVDGDELVVELVTETSRKAAEEIGMDALRDIINEEAYKEVYSKWLKDNFEATRKEGKIFAIKKNGDGVIISMKPTPENIKIVEERDDIERVVTEV